MSPRVRRIATFVSTAALFGGPSAAVVHAAVGGGTPPPVAHRSAPLPPRGAATALPIRSADDTKRAGLASAA